jgi:hypothetical protein
MKVIWTLLFDLFLNGQVARKNKLVFEFQNG